MQERRSWKAYEHLSGFEGNSRFYTWLGAYCRQPGADGTLRKRRSPNYRLARRTRGVWRGYDPAGGRGLGAFAGRTVRADRAFRHPLDCNKGAGATFLQNRFPIAGHRRNVNRRDVAAALGLSVPAVKSRLLRTVIETSPEAESLFSKGRRMQLKCKDIIQELANYC